MFASWRIWELPTPTVNIPARRPASMPAAASSNTTHFSGATFRTWAARENTSGSALLWKPGAAYNKVKIAC